MIGRASLGLVVLALVAAGCSSSSNTSNPSNPTTSTTTARTNALAATSWNLTKYLAGTAMKPAAAHPVAPLTFGASGQVTGSTGCNSFTGTYTSSASALTITLGPITLIGCPDNLSGQESAIKTNFPKVAAYAINSGVLTLSDAKGAELFSYNRASTSLAGTSWKVTGVNNGHGAVTTTSLTEKLTAVFEASGQFAGFGGCNTFSGPYKLSGKKGVAIGPLRSTLVACQGDVGEIETEYSTALSHVASYEIAGTTLTLRDKDNATQVTAQRA